MLTRFCIAAGASVLLGIVAGTPEPAFAATCTAEAYGGGSVRTSINMPPTSVITPFKDWKSTKTASSQRQACEQAVAELMAFLRTNYSKSGIEKALCRRAEHPEGGWALANWPLPGARVRATSLVVRASEDHDIRDVIGLGNVEIVCEEAANHEHGPDGAFCEEFARVTNPFRNVFRALRCRDPDRPGLPRETQTPASSASHEEWVNYCVRNRDKAFRAARTTVHRANWCLREKHRQLIDPTDRANVEAYCRRYSRYYVNFNNYMNQFSDLIINSQLRFRTDLGRPPGSQSATCTWRLPHQQKVLTTAHAYRACMDNAEQAALPMSPRRTLLHRVGGVLSTTVDCDRTDTVPECRPSYRYISRMIDNYRNCYRVIIFGSTWLYPTGDTP